MKRFFFPFSFFVILGLFASVTLAQEVQVALDNEGNVQVMTADLERRLELFSAYRIFQEARLYQVSDSSYVVEVIYGPPERVLKDRLPYTRQQVIDLRNQVSARLVERYPAQTIHQEGRTKLLVGSLLLSIGYYGWAVPEVLDVSGNQAYVAIDMLISAGGFFIPFMLTRNKTVTRGTAALCLYGASRGIGHGLLLDLLIEGEQNTNKGLITSGLVTSLGEGIAGYCIASTTNMSDGTACVIGVGGDFGIAIGAGAAYLADYSGGDTDRPVAGTILLGTAAGLWAGKQLADDQNYSRGDAYVVRAAGILGMYLPVAVLGSTKCTSGNAYMASAMGGLIAGAGVGHYLIRDTDFTSSQGTVIMAGEFAGGLLGLGLAYLVTPRQSDNPIPYFALSSAGAVGGFWATYSLFKHDQQTSQNNVTWSMDVVPKTVASLSTQRLFHSTQAKVIPSLRLEVNF